MATLKEIAAEAGVSISTVSRVLKGDTSLQVTSKTRDTIFRVADSLGYQRKKAPTPSEMNQSPVTITVYVPFTYLESTSLKETMRGIELYCISEGFLVKTIHHAPGNFPYDTNDVFTIYLERAIEIEDAQKDNSEKFTKNTRTITHSVQIDESYALRQWCTPEMPSTVVFSSMTSSRVRDSVRDLEAKGRIKEVIQCPRDDAAESYQTTMRLLSAAQRPERIIYGNQLLALGGLRAFFDKGVQPGHETKVACLHGDANARFMLPSLTVQEMPYRLAGELLVKNLFTSDETDEFQRKIILTPKIHWYASWKEFD
ncbi:LacI family DNA-binding transcriptional regulator [Aureibacillus halotolerans]|uniref:DNA-binding LacI/PurR family transcriptional regulator n=1 Tax=Aureibacillus halotolerans TaxID=1508390 RepID=A0A4V3D5E5_9BACI|nr:LacI family DNA-binding transcriptional regulator [Aureibacillus halotolerans]TDQ39777.1 DNA-binding LacI/PurR family transcriptional regulator [Aureibacillus halotolerans]